MEQISLELLTRWAKLLGWPDLIPHQQRIPDNVISNPNEEVVRWYDWGDSDDIAFHINEAPSWNACVYAIPYEICTGWHEFHLRSDGTNLHEEAKRLEEWLSYRWFASDQGRREFRMLHPECAGYTWQKIRECGVPYSPW